MSLIGQAYLHECCYCHELIDARRVGYYQRGRAWFKKQKTNSGSNSAALVEWANIYACRFCIQKQISGISLDQMALFQVDFPDD